MPSWHVEPAPLDLPPPDDPPRESHECGHPESCGEVAAMDSNVIRCGCCHAPVGLRRVKTKCSCQLAGAYETECLLMGRCSEGMEA